MANQTLRIKVEDDDDGKYKTGIDVDKLRTKKANNITWFFDVPRGFPNDSTLYLNFFTKDLSGAKLDSTGPMLGIQWTDGFGSAGANGRSIRGRVKNTVEGGFLYEIGYRDTYGTDHVLMDPEIVVEGNLDPAPPQGGPKGHRRKKAAKKATKAAKKSRAASRKKAAKKSATKKAGKKAKKAKARKATKARRSTKRKAKKR